MICTTPDVTLVAATWNPSCDQPMAVRLVKPVSAWVCVQASASAAGLRHTSAEPDPTATMAVWSAKLNAAALAAASDAAVCQPPTATGEPGTVDRHDGVANPAGKAIRPVTPAVVIVPRPDAGSSAASRLPDPAKLFAGTGKLPRPTPAEVSTVPLEASTNAITPAVAQPM